MASVNSALQRARATLREHLPERRLDWAPSAEPTEEERAVLRRYMEAVERADLAAVAELLAEDVRATMPPCPMWFARPRRRHGGAQRELGPRLAALCGPVPDGGDRANRQPAVALCTCRVGESFRAFAIGVLRIEDGLIAELTAFHDLGLFPPRSTCR